jgi:hypothetical protein
MSHADPRPADPFADEARAYLDGELPAEARARYEEHVVACAACRAALDEMVRTATRLDEALGEPATSVRRRVLARLAAASGPAREAGSEAHGPSSPAASGDGVRAIPSPDSSRAGPVPRPAVRGATMQKLQACPKCGAQFDVSAFAPGSQFTCGACGAVVTAGAPAPAVGRVPGSSRASAAPASAASSTRHGAATPGAAARGGPSAPSRGPQYRPVERHQQPGAAAATPVAAHGEGRRERGSRERPERGAGSKRRGNAAVVLGAVGGLVLVVVLAVVLLAGKKEPDPATGGGTNVGSTQGPGGAPGTGTGGGTNAAGAPPPVVVQDTVASLDAERAGKTGVATSKKTDWMKRYKVIATPEAMERAKAVAKDLIETADPADPGVKIAHELLGDVEFRHPIPESISFMKYPFIRAVEEANARRWFPADDKEQYELAKKAWDRTVKHGERLLNDRVYRALDNVRAQSIDRDDAFKDYNYEAYFASPYLICYSSKERMDEADLLKMSKAERKKALDELDKKRERWHKVLAEKGRIFQQTYAEFMKRYGEACDLKDLMAEYGGRSDYPIGKRSYMDGCPLIVWIFDNKEAFREYHKKVDRGGIDEGVAGYFSPKSGWVYLYDEDAHGREFEVNKNVHEATHQLQHWFTAQKNDWQTQARVPQSWFGEGFAEYMGAVTMDSDRNLTFVGLNRPRLGSNQQVEKMFKSQNKPLPIFPLQDLVGFEGYGAVTQYAGEKWGGQGASASMQLFYCQSWAFVYFLNEFQGGKYRAKFLKYVEEVLNLNHKASHFKRAFDIKSDADWASLQKEFSTYFTKELLPKNLKDGLVPMPGRDDWPSYKPQNQEEGR